MELEVEMSEIDKLYELQDKILTSLSDFLNSGNKFPFFLTGGTALIRFHLKITYRISYDLDFFSYEKITKEEVENIISFLFKKFNVSFKAENEEEKIFICELREGDLSVKVDFVEDPFLQVFEPEKLEETNLLIDSIQAIYFRKIYALIDLYIRGRPVDRIKDILDLMELGKRFLPLPDFVRKFVEIWRQNFETKIQAGLIAEALRDIFLVLPYHKQEIESALKRIYYSSIGYEEIEEWVRTQITLLKGMI